MSIDARLADSILRWLADGRTGISSETMAFCALGIERHYMGHPNDPADFNRCLVLLSYVPIVREAFPRIASLSRQWAALIDHWHELEALFLDEAGPNWFKAHKAPETFALMREILSGTGDGCPV